MGRLAITGTTGGVALVVVLGTVGTAAASSAAPATVPITAPTAATLNPAALRLRLSTHELPPYSSQALGAPSGMAVDAVVCAAQRLRIDLQLEFVPWSRAQKHALDGLSDGFFAASQSAARDAYATRSVVIAPQEWRWFYLRSSALPPQHADFRARARVSSFLGANMQLWLEEQGYGKQHPPRESDTLLRMLMAERLDAILANHLVMAQLLRDHPRRDEVRSELVVNKPLSVYLTHRYLATQAPDFMSRFNTALNACRRPEAKR